MDTIRNQRRDDFGRQPKDLCPAGQETRAAWWSSCQVHSGRRPVLKKTSTTTTSAFFYYSFLFVSTCSFLIDICLTEAGFLMGGGKGPLRNHGNRSICLHKQTKVATLSQLKMAGAPPHSSSCVWRTGIESGWISSHHATSIKRKKYTHHRIIYTPVLVVPLCLYQHDKYDCRALKINVPHILPKPIQNSLSLPSPSLLPQWLSIALNESCDRRCNKTS